MVPNEGRLISQSVREALEEVLVGEELICTFVVLSALVLLSELRGEEAAFVFE